MKNLIKINCSDTTYVCNFRPNISFYKDEKLFVGVVKDNWKNLNLYKSLFQFYISDLHISTSKNIYLFLYLENVYPTACNNISVSISGDNSDFNVSDVNWTTLPKKNSLAKININIPTKSVKKYLKIDISHIIKSLDPFSNNFNIIIESMNLNTASMLQFSSDKCSNSPYLVLVKDNVCDKYPINNDNDVNDTLDDENLNIEEISAEIINELNAHNLKLDSFEENLTNIMTHFDDINLTIKNTTTDAENKFKPTLNKFDQHLSDINDSINLLKDYIEDLGARGIIDNSELSREFLTALLSDLRDLTINEISQLKNSVNYDILEFKNSINDSISNINNSIEGIDDTLSFLSGKITKISEIVENLNPNNSIDTPTTI
ncbi:DNRLRE domain-containing protein [Clostridium chromiireducens]|nr:DNRLRE domain-containing protein [Clostridium chromiireducens]